LTIHLRAALAALALMPAAADAAPAAPRVSPDLAESAARIEAHVRFLADDLLEGREAGTRGFDLAALYVATQFRLLGLEPGGEQGGFFQTVPLLSGRLLEEGARLAVMRGSSTSELVFDEDFVPAINFDTGTCALEAPMVFVGHGVHAPELQYDDFAGVDVRGKVAVLLANAPARFPADQRAFHASGQEKLRELERRGAAGVIFLGDPESEARRAWALNAGNWARPGMRVLGADGRPLDTFPGLGCRVSVRVQRADVFFEGAAHSADEVWEMLAEGRLRAFDLPGRIALASTAHLAPVSSRNVVARVPGSDARLAAEHVVLTAHLDHLGIGAPRDGDAIYNGAHDNAVGIAILLEAGRMLGHDRARLRRSVLLVATTAEEKGLLGARHFVERPTVPLGSIVANVNMDMPLPFTEVLDVVPTGIEHSTLDAVARRAIARAGLGLTPDPLPEEVTFVRSDQYPFVRAGIPAVYLKSGVRPSDGSDGLAQVKAFRASVYHLPNDDLTQPFDWPTAARLAKVNQWIALEVSNTAQRPAWKPGNFFGGKFGGRLEEHDPHD
jgi:Zn-dependent M28 family amino/carboxypeptidase